MVVDPIIVPKLLEERGYGADIITRRLIDKLKEIRSYHWGRAGEVASPDDQTEEIASLDQTLPNFEILDTGVSLQSFLQFIERLVPQTATHINGEITMIDDSEPPKYMARFRIVRKGSTEFRDSEPFAAPPSDESMMSFAHDILKVTNVCAVAAYDYTKSPSTALKEAQYCVDHARGSAKALGYQVQARLFLDDRKPTEALNKINCAIQLRRKPPLLETRSAIMKQLGKAIQEGSAASTACK